MSSTTVVERVEVVPVVVREAERRGDRGVHVAIGRPLARGREEAEREVVARFIAAHGT
jgi:hypothetical protein